MSDWRLIDFLHKIFGYTMCRLVVTMAAFGTLATTAGAGCLNIDYNFGISGRWVNYCNVGISIVWMDQQYCMSEQRAKFPCAEYIGPNGTQSALLRGVGQITWLECQSPGGPGDVVAIERGWGNVICSD
jgi:hypothetical protein